MKLTKKILISLISAAAVALSLVACNANETSSKAESNATSIVSEIISDNKNSSSEIATDEAENEYVVKMYANDDFSHTFNVVASEEKSLFNATLEYLDTNHITYEVTGFDETGYIAKIDEYGEKTEGNSYTGWTYTINGEFASVGMGQCYPQKGDVIELTYSTMTW